MLLVVCSSLLLITCDSITAHAQGKKKPEGPRDKWHNRAARPRHLAPFLGCMLAAAVASSCGRYYCMQPEDWCCFGVLAHHFGGVDPTAEKLNLLLNSSFSITSFS